MAICDGRMPPPSPARRFKARKQTPLLSIPILFLLDIADSVFIFKHNRTRIIETYVFCAASDSLVLILNYVHQMILLHI